MADNRTGIVLAGGTSEHFGEREKALVELDGKALIAHVVDRLNSVTDKVLVTCRSAVRPALEDALRGTGIRFVAEETPDQGPLFGLALALDAASTETVAVVACDMPRVDPRFLAYLVERMGGNDGAVPLAQDGTPQPTQAVYDRTAAREAAAQSVAAGESSLQSMLEYLQVSMVPPAEVAQITDRESLESVTTPGDLDSLD